MNKLSALGVAREDDFGVRAAGDSLLSSVFLDPRLCSMLRTHAADEICHGGATSCISTLEEANHVCRVSHTLNSKLACSSDTASDLVEEQRAYGCGVADVALLSGSARVDDADGTAGGPAVGELVVGAAAVLALREGVILK